MDSMSLYAYELSAALLYPSQHRILHVEKPQNIIFESSQFLTRAFKAPYLTYIYTGLRRHASVPKPKKKEL
jgi:hypothetical protein